MPVQRHFLPWDRPLLQQAVAFLAGGWEGRGPLDLSRLLVVVPTRQAGRRLREGLAGHAFTKGRAVFPPRVVTPEALLAEAPVAGAATRLESLLAWAETLRGEDLSRFREVFRVDIPSRGFAWALRTADRLLAVQSELAEGALRMEEVAGRAGEAFPETERWKQLGELERCYDDRLREKSLIDPQRAKIAAAREPRVPEGVERVVVAAVPDPMPLAVTALDAFARKLPVDVLVFAPAGESGGFDAWGRPDTQAWRDWRLELLDFEERVRLFADPAEQADHVAALALSYGEPEGRLAVGLADAEVAAALEGALRRSGLEAFDPEGRSRSEGELYFLLSALRDLVRDPSFEAAEALGRCPAFQEYLGGRAGKDFSAAAWLRSLDELRRRHLPADLASAREWAAGLAGHPLVGPGLDAIARIREALVSVGFAEGARTAPRTIFERRLLDLGREADVMLTDEAGDWMDAVAECERIGKLWPGLAREDCWELALRLYGEKRSSEDKPEGAIEIQGWLELLWEDAPHLVIVGMNDGRVPEAIAGDAFLPESLRASVGLKTNAARFARDAYLLQALAACRGKGRLDLLVGKTSGAGEPLKPSRLLFRCADGDLPGRVEFLFRRIEASRQHLAWSRAWKVEPPRSAPQTTAPATALRQWLECPFRFYLRHVLGMAPVEAAKNELDDLDFGTLCHEVLEVLGRDARLRDCTDPGSLRKSLSAELDRRIREKFGKNLALPLAIQREAARQRLGKAAEIQARERAGGWQIAEVERRVEFTIEGLLVTGKVDRIDRHLKTGDFRILDYKTSDTPKTPHQYHLRPARPSEVTPEWARCEVEGKPKAWADLQLPFYRISLAGEFPGASFGYFNLPKAVGETGLALWEPYPPDLEQSAARCASGVCSAIRRGEFWPPTEGIPADEDDFAPLFHRGVEASVAWRTGR